MVKIRLTRTGKKGQPHYRIVAVDSRVKRDGKYIEQVGYYNPRTNPSTVEVDKEVAQKWLDNGAQPTDTVKALLVKAGVMKSDYEAPKAKKATTKSSSKKTSKAASAKAPAKKTSKASSKS